MLGLDPSSYEAYCLDEAIWYCGMHIQSELDKAARAGQKKSKDSGKAEAAQKKVLEKYIGKMETPASQREFADPAALFNQT